jgi:hypothetical protein
MNRIREQGLLVKSVDGADIVREMICRLMVVLRAEAAKLIEGALEEELERYLGRKPYQRSNRRSGRRVQAACRKCGSQYQRDFLRHGHRKRGLAILYGLLLIWAPRVICRCGGSVRIPSQVLRPGQRIWHDVTLRIQRWGEKAVSLRQIQGDLAEELSTSLGLRTINERLQAVHFRKPGAMVLSTVPPVVLLDGIRVTLLAPTGEYRQDRSGRRRPVKKKAKVVILIALAMWPQTGTIGVLDWEIASGESCQEWEQLLNRLYRRQLWPQRGLRLFVHDGDRGLKAALKKWYWDVPSQRCIFHKLRNVWNAVVLPEDEPGHENLPVRRLLIRQAAAVFRAPDEPTARRLLADFVDHWKEEQPQAVATLLRDLEDTLRFYSFLKSNPRWKREALRTTSRLERLNRKLRRVFRLAGAYHSRAGLEAAVLRVLAPMVVV